MNYYCDRVRSFFGNWSLYTHIYTAQMMALAGFEYVGPKDKVRCASCLLELDNWEERDLPYVEHLSWTAVKCNFMDMSGVSHVTENITLGRGACSSKHQSVAQKRTSEACTSTLSPSPNTIENEIFLPRQHQPNEILVPQKIQPQFMCPQQNNVCTPLQPTYKRMRTESSGDKYRSVHTSQLPENPYQNQVVNTPLNGQSITPMPVNRTNSRQKQIEAFQRQYQNDNQPSLNDWTVNNSNSNSVDINNVEVANMYNH